MRVLCTVVGGTGPAEPMAPTPGTVSDDWTTVLTSAGRRALGRLPEVATAVVEFGYGSLAADPYRVGKALAGLHSARRGDYRVVCRIVAEASRVEVVEVEHRADAYRPHGPWGLLR